MMVERKKELQQLFRPHLPFDGSWKQLISWVCGVLDRSMENITTFLPALSLCVCVCVCVCVTAVVLSF